MIPSLAEIVSSIAGGARLLCFKAEGLKPLKRDDGAPGRSFVVVLLALPAFLLLLWQRHHLVAEDAAPHFYATWLLTYLVSWLAFPVVLFAVAKQLPLRRGLPFFIQARNWMLVPGIYASLAAFWLAQSTLLPGDLSELLGFAVEAWILAAEWWLIRRILSASAGQAVLLVLIDFMLDYALAVWAISRTALPLAGG
jgi:hypothetical protein